MESIVRTIYSAHVTTTKMLGKPFSVLPNSTLNEKFNLFPDELPTTNDSPSLKYLAIGNKGATYESTTDGYLLTSPIPHLPRHASLYNFLPFIIRPINDDLTATERLGYRLRVPTTIGGVDYVAYYLKVLDVDNVTPSVELRSVVDTQISTVNFTPEASDLSPTAPDLSNSNLNTPNGDYLVSTAKINVTLSQTDIQEILDACAIIYGDIRYAVINEIALCTGIDRTLQGNFGNTTSSYVESVATQIAVFISQYHALTQTSTSVNMEFDIGSVEPLLV